MHTSDSADRKRLELLDEFANQLLLAETEKDVVWSIAKQAIAHLGFEDCVIYLHDIGKDVLYQAAAHGPKNPIALDILNPILIPIGQGIVGEAAATGEIQRVDDVSQDDRYILDDEQRQSELAVPMMHRGQCIGVVDSEDRRKGFYNDDHESILRTVGALGAARIVHIRALEDLQQSRSGFQQMVEHASDMVFRADMRGQFTYVNPVAVHFTGFSEEELLQSSFNDLVAEAQKDRVATFYRNQVKDKTQSSYLEFQIETKNGHLEWVGQSLQLVMEKDRVVGFQAIARDITSLKMAQGAVSRSEAIQRAMLDASLDAIISIDQGGQVIEFNPAAESTFGYSLEEAFGRTLSNLIIPEELREAHSAGMKRLLDTGVSRLIGQRIEVPALHKDGHQFPIELAITKIPTEQGVQFTAFARDITEQKAAQEATEEARKQAENYAEAQTRFLSSMSHEIRTPLNAVIGISHLISGTNLTDKQRKYVLDIQRAGNVLLGLINNILDFQKIESGFLQLESVAFDLHDVLNEVMDRARYVAGDKSITLELDMEQSVPQWVNSDPVRLTQILTNLLNNAVKFTPKGRVALHVSGFRKDDGPVELRFEVSDTGIGIPEEARERVFATFQQASSDTTRRYGGSGLGLPIVKQLVKAFEGEIDFTSTEGEGTTFVVGLPFEVASEGQAREVTSDTEELILESVRVLVVEDNPVNQFVAQELLESWKAEVTIASMGQEALDILKQVQFDIVLMDIQMPDMDGFETTKRIRTDLDISSETLPVIALTASALREQRDRAYAAGMNDFVMKPFDPVYLHSRITSLLKSPLFSIDNPPDAGQTDWTFFEANYGTSVSLRNRILGIMSEALPDQVSALEQALEDRDTAGIKFVSHKLLSSVRMVGASELESQCEAVGELDESAEEELMELGAQILVRMTALRTEIEELQSS